MNVPYQPILTPEAVIEEEEEYDLHMIQIRFPRLFESVDTTHLLSSPTFKYIKHLKTIKWQDCYSQKPLSQDEVIKNILSCVRSLRGGCTVKLSTTQNQVFASFSHLDTWEHYAWGKLKDEDHPLSQENAPMYCLWTSHLLERWNIKDNKSDVMIRERCGFLKGILCFINKLMANDQVRNEMLRARYSSAGMSS